MGLQPKGPTVKGPADWFTGDVWLDTLAAVDDVSPFNIAAVHFTPGARTAWHSHAGGQTLHVLEGRGVVQNRGGERVDLRAGDTHTTPDGQVHWHGSDGVHFMAHLSITSGAADWGEQVTEAEAGG